MKVKVNKEACIGCGACAAICDAIFEIDDEINSSQFIEFRTISNFQNFKK